MSNDDRFRQVQRFSVAHGFVGGLPNFHEANYGAGVVYGTLLFRANAAEQRGVDRAAINVFHIEDVPGMFQGLDRYVLANGLEPAFPNFEQSDNNGVVTCGAIFLKPGATERREVLRDEIGVYQINDVPAMLRGVHNYALANGYAGGYPTFEQADHGNGVVYGVVLFHLGTVRWKDLPADFLALYSKPKRCAIVICHPSDGSPQMSAEAQFSAFFTRAGRGGAYDYWYDVSYGTINMAASRVFPRVQLDVDLAAINNLTGHTQRGQIYRWGADAAARDGIDLSQFDHTIIVLEQLCDSGSVGKNVVIGRAPSFSLLDNVSFIAHELGHAFGLYHSLGEESAPCAAGDPRAGAYCDKFDMMSYVNVHHFDNNGVFSGPGLCAFNLRIVKALHRYRIWQPASDSFSQVVTLAALNRPDIDEYLAAIFTTHDPFMPNLAPDTYSVEYREPTGWDRGFSGPVVLIHQLTGDGHAKLLTKPENRGGILPFGATFCTPDGSTAVRFEAHNAAAHTVQLKIWRVLGLRIRHIVFNPPGRDPPLERVILENAGVDPIDLTGWTMHDKAEHEFKFPSITVPGGFVFAVWTGKGNNTFGNLYWGRDAAVWNNEGDTAIINDASGQEVTRFTYQPR